MKNFAAFYDDKVIFSTKIQKSSGLPTTLSWDSLFTPHGFIVPYSLSCFAILDIIEENKVPVDRSGEMLGMLITPEGRVYEYAVGSNNKVICNRLVIGKGFRHCRSADYLTEDTMNSAIHLTTSPEAALDWFHKTLPTFTNSYFVMSVDDIVAKIKEKGL